MSKVIFFVFITLSLFISQSCSINFPVGQKVHFDIDSTNLAIKGELSSNLSGSWFSMSNEKYQKKFEITSDTTLKLRRTIYDVILTKENYLPFDSVIYPKRFNPVSLFGTLIGASLTAPGIYLMTDDSPLSFFGGAFLATVGITMFTADLTTQIVSTDGKLHKKVINISSSSLEKKHNNKFVDSLTFFTSNLGSETVKNLSNHLGLEFNTETTLMNNQKLSIETDIFDNGPKTNPYKVKHSSGVYVVNYKTIWRFKNIYNEVIYSDTTFFSKGSYSYLNRAIENSYLYGLNNIFKSSDFENFCKNLLGRENQTPITIDSVHQTPPEKGLGNIPKSVFSVKNGNIFGTGFVISEEGYAITSYSAISNRTDDIVDIKFNDSKTTATVVNINKKMNLALIKLEGDSFVPLEFSAKSIEPNSDEYFCIGYFTDNRSRTLTKGTVSNHISQNDATYYQIDIAINPGFNGAPIVGADGKIIGMVTGKYEVSESFISFALSSEFFCNALNIRIK